MKDIPDIMDGNMLIKRLEEFQNNLNGATSQVMKDLLIAAINMTEQTVFELVEFEKQFLTYFKLMCEEISIDQSVILEGAKEIIQNYKGNIGLITNNELKQYFEENFNSSLKTVKMLGAVDGQLAILNLTTLFKSNQILIYTLSELIIKPDIKNLNYERILDILQYIIAKLIPLFDEAVLLDEFSIEKRKKKKFENADDYICYLENYIASLNIWNLTAKSITKKFKVQPK